MTSNDAAMRFFDEKLIALSEAAPHLKLAWQRSGASFYDDAYPSSFIAEDMGNSAVANLIGQLGMLWSQYPELLALLPELEAIATQVESERCVDDSGPDAPSTLVYQMW